MKHVRLAHIAAIVWILVAAPSRAAEELPPELVARTSPLTPEEEKQKFRLPPGFDIELVAAEPDIRKPMNLAFDDRGRLWATGSIEYPFGAKDGEALRDQVKIFEDADGDGRHEKIKVFAGDLNIPIGLFPLPNGAGAIVFSLGHYQSEPARLYKLLDIDGDDIADERHVFFSGFGHVDRHGNINGLRHHIDGWLYACHGFSNTSDIKDSDGHNLRMNSGNTFRMRLDGTHLEQVSWGQVNPFGICFDPRGDLYSADCHSLPGYLLLRGAYYPSFGKPHDGLGFGPQIMNHDHGSTAISGIVYYTADHFPAEYKDTIFIGNVVTNRINHDRIERTGSSVKAVLQPDFMSSEDPWFRPVDLRLGPDGALYVADFYNRIIGHYEVPLTHPGRDRERGRIWRIVYRGADGRGKARHPLPDIRGASVPQLAEALGTPPNATLAVMAANELSRRGGEEVAAAARRGLRSPAEPVRWHSLWILERISALEPAELASAAADSAEVVRVHVQRLIAERKDWTKSDRDLVLAGLRDAVPMVRRVAADALGRHPSAANVAPLFELRRSIPADDPFLLHVTRMALRDQLQAQGVWETLAKSSEEDRELTADVAPGAHTPQSAVFLLEHRMKRSGWRDSLPDEARFLARYLPPERLRDVSRLAREAAGADLGRRVALLKELQRGREEAGGALDDETRRSASELASELFSAVDARKTKLGLDLVRSLKLTGLDDRLEAIGRNKQEPEDSRREALEALVAIDAARSVPHLRAILADPAEPTGLREHIAGLLGGIQKPEALEALATALEVVPARLAVRIAAAMVRTGEGSERLLVLVERGKASARLLKERDVAGRLSRSSPAVRDRLQKLVEGLPDVERGIDQLIQDRRRGFRDAKPDLARGAAVFEKTCAPCHRLGDKGTKIGPDLAGIGLRGPERILEDLLDPSRNVDQTFSTTILISKSNLVTSGLFLREEGEVLVMANSEGKEVRVPKADVKSRETSPLSPMPSNFTETVTVEDLYHLLAYLLETKEKGPAGN